MFLIVFRDDNKEGGHGSLEEDQTVAKKGTSSPSYRRVLLSPLPLTHI